MAILIFWGFHQEHLQELQKELAELRSQFKEMKAKWENEKEAIGKVQKLREEIDQVNGEIEKAERSYDLNKLAELKYGRLPALQKELQEEERIAEEGQSNASLLHDKVTEEEIAKIVGRWTGIPVSKLMEASGISCCGWRISSTSGSSARMRR